MAEQKVPYQVDDRQFEGVIVYDDSVTAKRPIVFMQPDWKGVCPDTIGQARAVAGKDYVVLMADMFGSGYGAKPKTVDDLRAGMLAVHKNLPFTLACGGKAYDTLLAEAQQARRRRHDKDRGDRLLRGRRLRPRTGARGREFRGRSRLPCHKSESGRCRHALQHQGPRTGDPRLGGSGYAETDDGRLRG